MDEQTNEAQAADAPNEDDSVEQTQEQSEETQSQQKVEDQKQVQDNDETEDTDDDFSYQYEPSQPDVPSLDFANLPTNEDGTVDADAFQEAINNYGKQVFEAASQHAGQQSAQTYQLMRAEEKAWDKIQEDYPEVSQSKKLKRIIHNQRNADIMDGGRGDLRQAAKEVMEEFRGAKSQGKTEAQESIKVQQSAHLESSGVTSSNKTNKRKELYSQAINSRGRDRDEARQQLLKDMISKGDI